MSEFRRDDLEKDMVDKIRTDVARELRKYARRVKVEAERIGLARLQLARAEDIDTEAIATEAIREGSLEALGFVLGQKVTYELPSSTS